MPICLLFTTPNKPSSLNLLLVDPVLYTPNHLVGPLLSPFNLSTSLRLPLTIFFCSSPRNLQWTSHLISCIFLTLPFPIQTVTCLLLITTYIYFHTNTSTAVICTNARTVSLTDYKLLVLCRLLCWLLCKKAHLLFPDTLIDITKYTGSSYKPGLI